MLLQGWVTIVLPKRRLSELLRRKHQPRVNRLLRHSRLPRVNQPLRHSRAVRLSHPPDYPEPSVPEQPSAPSQLSEPSQSSTPSQPEATVEEPEPDTLNVTVGNIKTDLPGKGITPKIVVKDPVDTRKIETKRITPYLMKIM